MLKRVSSHLKNLTTGFLGNAVNNVTGFVGGMTPSITGQQAKVAAELLKKSPLEINDSLQEKYKSDPLGFSQVQYPLDLTSTELGHYIIFYTLQNKYSPQQDKDLAVASKVGLANTVSQAIGDTDIGGKTITTMKQLRNLKNAAGKTIDAVKTDNSVFSKIPTHTQVTSAISLYMPPSVKVSYGAKYGLEETSISGDIAKAVGNFKSANSTSAQVEALLGGVGGAAVQGIKEALSSGVSLAGAGDPFKVFLKSRGASINPHEELFFEAPEFRSFSYDFEFYPKSRKELEAVQNIIFLFKYHMHPDLAANAQGGRLFYVPSEFEIHYAHLDRENEYMNKISKCVLEKCDVSYGPDEQASFFKGDERGAPPVSYKMSLSFRETEFMTKDKIYRGF